MSTKLAVLFSLLTSLAGFAEGFRVTATGDPRINEVFFSKWGNPGQALIEGPFVPNGKIWIIEYAGITTKDGRSFEWMMQVTVKNPNGDGSVNHSLVPCHRDPGYSSGTPVLAIPRRIILTAGKTLSARCNGLYADPEHPELNNIMGLLFSGWEVPANCLGSLIGIGAPVETVDPALASVNREISDQEKLLQLLKGM